ncbi:GntR family transcriptional regulator [Roseomonas hellenica]|uniref:GntR family transcriptional regulator n=1 Tax=Plastoroseomonas hellenica TaxID=2687306 RepID=A0ABS5EYP7_9PROT|nr:GntR family transcriptional regulator [Plastoroseomonas hellenica]MBR0665409.1 GntR family transcriptional regulator [Plastoroseomonas hellenica]
MPLTVQPKNAEEGLALEELAYRRLREALGGGAFLPGDRLSIRRVADALGMSSMPARTALRRLAAEQALDLLPTGTAVVPRLTRPAFIELSAIRAELEPLALRLAAPHLDGAALHGLAAIVAGHDEARARGDSDAVRRLDRDFLFTIYRAAQAPLLLNLIETLWLRRGPIFWELRWAALAAGGMRHAHGEILLALRGGQIAAASAALRQEITDASLFIQGAMRFADDDAPKDRLAALKRPQARALGG